jgi:RimK family alpha-L-glutamate ligase
MLFQEFIKSSKGKDLRLQVVGNQVVAAMYRYSENGDFRANITNGGKMKLFDPSEEQVELAIKCCKIIGLDFAGVDILFGENQEPIVCEVNSNAHFKNIFDCTGINVADCILEYIIKRICIG